MIFDVSSWWMYCSLMTGWYGMMTLIGLNGTLMTLIGLIFAVLMERR
jgi:hypothetical protein